MSEYPEDQPITPEVPAEKAYVAAAREVIAKAGETAPETDARFEVVDSYVDQLLVAADAGEITGSAGTYSREQLLSQFRDFLSDMYQPEDQRRAPDPYAFIPSKDGMRRAFRLLMDDTETHSDFELSLRLHLKPKGESPQTETNEIITGIPEALRTKAEEDLGEEAVEATGLIEPDAAQAASRVMFGESSGPTERMEETEDEKYARFERETREELQRLYREHRQVDSRSIEADALENQIAHAKEDLGKFTQERRRLQGK